MCRKRPHKSVTHTQSVPLMKTTNYIGEFLWWETVYSRCAFLLLSGFFLQRLVQKKFCCSAASGPSPPRCRRLQWPRCAESPLVRTASMARRAEQQRPGGRLKSPSRRGVGSTEVELSSGHSPQQPPRAQMPCRPVPRPFGSPPPEAPPLELARLLLLLLLAR